MALSSLLQKVDFSADGLKLICEPCWARIDDFRQFSMHVENIHISYVRHFLKDDGTFNDFDDISQYYVQVDDIHNMHAVQLLKNGGDDKKFEYIEPFCVINVDENDEGNAMQNNQSGASTSPNQKLVENDRLSVGDDDGDAMKNETECKDMKMESVVSTDSSYEPNTPDDGLDVDDEADDDDEYEGESETSEESKKPPISKTHRKYASKSLKVGPGDGGNKKSTYLKSGLDFGSADERSILLLKYVQLKCDLCSDRVFRSFPDVQRHFWDEHEQNGYVRCCNRKFRRLARILQHCRWHENPEAFK